MSNKKQNELIDMKQYVVKEYTIEAESTTDYNQESSTFQLRGIANSGLKDRWDEVMPKSCWDLGNYLKNPIMLLDHDYRNQVGRITEIYSTETGLKFVAQIGKEGVPMTTMQRDTVNLIRQGILKTFSVGFIAKDYDYDTKTGTTVYTNVELLEISLVAVPMDANALMEGFGYKSIGALEKALKKGISMSDFETIVKKLDEAKETLLKTIDEKIVAIEKRLDDKVESDKIIMQKNAKIEELEANKKELEACVIEMTELVNATYTTEKGV